MSRPNLKLATESADMAYADHMLSESEIAHQIEREAEQAMVRTDAFDARQDEIAVHEAEVAADVARQASYAAKREDARRKLMKAEAVCDSIIIIARAKARAGHDLTTWTPSEAQHVLNAYEMLHEAQTTPAPDLPGAFKAESDPAALARGAAVGDILQTK